MKLLEVLEQDNRLKRLSIQKYLTEIIEKCNELMPIEAGKYNEYEFNHIRSKTNLIFKKLAKMVRNYDIINLINSGELEQDGKNTD